MHRILAFVFSTIPLFTWALPAQGAERPNMLWLVAEDFGPKLACYGTDQVSSPNLERLASKSDATEALMDTTVIITKISNFLCPSSVAPD